MVVPIKAGLGLDLQKKPLIVNAPSPPDIRDVEFVMQVRFRLPDDSCTVGDGVPFVESCEESGTLGQLGIVIRELFPPENFRGEPEKLSFPRATFEFESCPRLQPPIEVFCQPLGQSGSPGRSKILCPAQAETNEGVREITDATDQQAASTEETVTTIERIEETSQETAEEAADLADDATTQADALDATATHVHELADQAETLIELLDEFTLGTTDRASVADARAARAD